MCSVVRCGSWRRGAPRFKLPEDPERRLEWVQFLFEVNGQKLKESSWTDITICSEHFTEDCFANLSQPGRVQLKSSAAPSLCVKSESESDEPDQHLESPTCGEPVGTEHQLKTGDGHTSYSEESRLTSMAAQGSSVLRGISSSTDTSDTSISVYGQIHPTNENFDLISEKAALLQMKGKYVVNEKRLLQLFSHKCPLCGSKVKMEKVTYGVLLVLNQQCLQCEYRNQWKSQVNASVPEDQHLTGGTEVILETRQALPTDDTHCTLTGVHEVVAVLNEESDPMEESEESSEQEEPDSDEDWEPMEESLLATRKRTKADDELEDEEDYDEDDDEDEGEAEKEGECPPLTPKHSELCTECGKIFRKRWPHTCEHKIKPYSCNICGKRCVSKFALTSHGRIHNENYEHRCKYCHVKFKTKVDKVTHEQIHLTEGKPYKCPDCSETFTSNKERRVHLEDHRGPPQLKCHICGIEFLQPPYLQRHLAVHTGEKPFKCSVCQRGFNQSGHLKSHMRLHTGERPYKCQHCDKSFNHNVSLKSHIHRYHSSNSGEKRGKKNKPVRDPVDAEDNGNKKGTDSGLDNVEEDKEEEVQEKILYIPKKKYHKTTGRPIGRPKSFESGNVVVEVQEEGQSSNTETAKVQKLKRTQRSDEGSEDEPSYDDTFFDFAEEEEEEEEWSKKAIKNTARSRGRPNYSDSDSDFDPEGRKKKRLSSQNSGKSSGKRRGRPRKNPVVEDY